MWPEHTAMGDGATHVHGVGALNAFTTFDASNEALYMAALEIASRNPGLEIYIFGLESWLFCYPVCGNKDPRLLKGIPLQAQKFKFLQTLASSFEPRNKEMLSVHGWIIVKN
jgi:hypothetical protein